jgi:hypothetical protein
VIPKVFVAFVAFVVWPVAVGYTVFRWASDPWTFVRRPQRPSPGSLRVLR